MSPSVYRYLEPATICPAETPVILQARNVSLPHPTIVIIGQSSFRSLGLPCELQLHHLCEAYHFPATLYRKNDTVLHSAHYNFDIHQPILTIFGRNVADGVSYQNYDLFSHITYVMCLHYLRKQEPRKLHLFT